jgi:hypothetical protein
MTGTGAQLSEGCGDGDLRPDDTPMFATDLLVA